MTAEAFTLLVAVTFLAASLVALAGIVAGLSDLERSRDEREMRLAKR